jgi:hypothetical protein
MLKNAVLAALVLVPSLASAEIQTKKAPVRMTRAASVEATAVAMNAALTVDGMVEKINTKYIAGLRRCYQKGLATNPALKGKVTLTFSISSYGNVAGAAEGISKQVDDCVARQIKHWKFGRPTDRREANFRISLLLAQ